MNTWRIKLNWAAPINIAAIYFGGKWVLSLLGVSVEWGQYTLAALAATLIWVLANLKFETETVYRRR